MRFGHKTSYRLVSTTQMMFIIRLQSSALLGYERIYGSISHGNSETKDWATENDLSQTLPIVICD